MSNFCHVESNACIMLMYWVCVNVFLPKKKTKLGHSRPEATWMYCSTYCSIVSLLLLVPLADNFSQNLSPSLLSIFVSHIEYSMFKTFSAGRHTWQCKFWIKCDTSAMYESTVAFLLHLIELNLTQQKCDNELGLRALSTYKLMSNGTMYMNHWFCCSRKYPHLSHAGNSSFGSYLSNIFC